MDDIEIDADDIEEEVSVHSRYTNLAVINQLCQMNLVDGTDSIYKALHRLELKQCKKALTIIQLSLDIEKIDMEITLIQRNKTLKSIMKPSKPMFTTKKLRPIK